MNDIPNTPPIARDDEASTPVGTDVIIDVLSNDSDPDGNSFGFYGVPIAEHGWVEILPDNTILYHPNPDFVGTDTIKYTIIDEHKATDFGYVTVHVGTAPDYVVEGTAGDDLIDYDYNGDPEGDMVDHNDNQTGTQDDLIEAYEGDDTIYAGDGDDTIDAGDGADSAFGGSGDDVIDTSGSDPRSDYGWAPDGIAPDADPDDDRDFVDGGDGDDIITTGDDADTILGGTGDDTIDGGLDDDQIDGGTGDDVITGGAGSDSVLGGAGDDVIDTSGSRPASDYGWVPGGIDPDADPENDRDLVSGGSGDDIIATGDDADTV